MSNEELSASGCGSPPRTSALATAPTSASFPAAAPLSAATRARLRLLLPCAVCGDDDVARGRHYRVWSCDRCRSFFRRYTIHKFAVTCLTGRDDCSLKGLPSWTRCPKCLVAACTAAGFQGDLIKSRSNHKLSAVNYSSATGLVVSPIQLAAQSQKKFVRRLLVKRLCRVREKWIVCAMPRLSPMLPVSKVSETREMPRLSSELLPLKTRVACTQTWSIPACVHPNPVSTRGAQGKPVVLELK